MIWLRGWRALECRLAVNLKTGVAVNASLVFFVLISESLHSQVASCTIFCWLFVAGVRATRRLLRQWGRVLSVAFAIVVRLPFELAAHYPLLAEGGVRARSQQRQVHVAHFRFLQALAGVYVFYRFFLQNTIKTSVTSEFFVEFNRKFYKNQR